MNPQFRKYISRKRNGEIASESEIQRPGCEVTSPGQHTNRSDYICTHSSTATWATQPEDGTIGVIAYSVAPAELGKLCLNFGICIGILLSLRIRQCRAIPIRGFLTISRGQRTSSASIITGLDTGSKSRSRRHPWVKWPLRGMSGSLHGVPKEKERSP